MHRVHDFKANLETLPRQEGEANRSHVAEETDVELYTHNSTTRNICFVWTDGRRVLFNYAYLVSVDLTVTDTLNRMALTFGSYTVLLKGYQLGLLFDFLMNHTPKVITMTDPRYAPGDPTQIFVVIEIVVKSE